jgi:hypothetical protein
MATEIIEITTNNNIIKIPDNNYQSISLKAIKIPIKYEHQFRSISELILYIQSSKISIPIELLLITSTIKTNNTYCLITISKKIFLKNNIPPDVYFKLKCKDLINCTFIIKGNTISSKTCIINEYISVNFINIGSIPLPSMRCPMSLFISINKKIKNITIQYDNNMFYYDHETIKRNGGIIREVEKFKYSNSLSETLLNGIPSELINIIEQYAIQGKFVYWISINLDPTQKLIKSFSLSEQCIGTIFLASDKILNYY